MKHMNEIVYSLDETLSIWRNEHGYYWYDSFDRQRSREYFNTTNEAEVDCQDLIYQGAKP